MTLKKLKLLINFHILASGVGSYFFSNILIGFLLLECDMVMVIKINIFRP